MTENETLQRRFKRLYLHLDEEGLHVHASTVALAIEGTEKRGRGRPPTGFNKTAYMKEYMRKRRAAKTLPSQAK